MEIKNIENGRYNTKGMLKFDTNKGEIQIKASEAMEIVWALFDYCNLDYMDSFRDLEERLFDEVDTMVRERKKEKEKK